MSWTLPQNSHNFREQIRINHRNSSALQQLTLQVESHIDDLKDGNEIQEDLRREN